MTKRRCQPRARCVRSKKGLYREGVGTRCLGPVETPGHGADLWIGNGAESAMEHAALWHIPLSHFKREGTLGTLDTRASRTAARCWRGGTPDPRLAREGARQLPILFPGRRAIGDFDAYHRRARRPLSRAVAVSRWEAAAAETRDSHGRLFRRAARPGLRAAIVTPLFRHHPDLAAARPDTGMPDKAYQTLPALVRMLPGVLPLPSQDQRREARDRRAPP